MHEAPQKPETPDYYADLGIAEDATTTEIKKAYRGLALLYHPDKKAPGKKIDAVDFRRVNEAYEVLGDLEERKIYDEGHWYIRTQWTAYQRQFDEWEAQQEAERLRKAAEEEERRRAIEELERLRAKEEAERRRAEDAKRQRWQDECDNARRYSMADWAYRQAQRLKEEARQREEDDRGQREREEVLSRKKDAERAEQKAEEQREKVREWARKQAEKEEEQQRQQRRAERARKCRARGLPPCLDSLDCSCKTCFYEYYWQRYKRDHAYANAFDEGDMWERMEEAERASEEAAQRAAAENDRKARERLEKIEEAEKKKKERDQKALERKQAARARCAERSTHAAAQKQRAEQEKMAKLRMANQHIKEQQDNYLAGCGEDAISTEKVVIDIGWKKVKGAAMCLFCEDEINYYSFRCPDGGAIACNPCKNRMCHFTLPKISKALDDEDLVEPGAAK